jgi:hypothetical protein
MSQILTSTDGSANSGDARWGQGSEIISDGSVWKMPVQVSTFGLGNIALSPAPATVDGEPISQGDRVGVMDQTAGEENGLYEHDGTDLVRASDYTTDSLVEAGVKVYAQKGTSNAEKTFRLNSPTTDIIVGTTATVWAEEGGGGGGEDLAATLVLGNTTGDPGTAGLPIKGPAAAPASGDDGAPLILMGGDGDGAGDRGAIQADTYGNTRGIYAVDLQQARSAVGQVAAGPYSAMIGGKRNAIAPDGRYAAIIGGIGNYIGYGGYGSAALAGNGNVVEKSGFYYAYYSVIGGQQNTIRPDPTNYAGAYSSVAFGFSNNMYGGTESMVMGRNMEVLGENSFGGGNESTLYGDYAFGWGKQFDSHPRSNYSQVWGVGTYAYVRGQTAWGSIRTGAWSNGEGQGTRYTLAQSTTDATPEEMNTEATNFPSSFTRLLIRPGRTYACRIVISARQTGGTAGTVGDSAMWEIQACIKRDLANNTSLVGSAGTGTAPAALRDAGAAAWSIAVTADDTNEALVVTVTGEADKTIRWLAHIFAAEVGSDT